MNSQLYTAVTAVSLTAAIAPVASVQADPAPSTLEQVVHADARIRHGGAIAGDSVPFSVFEHTEISAADILNRQELYHVNPNVVPAAPGYGTANVGGGIVAQTRTAKPSEPAWSRVATPTSCIRSACDKVLLKPVM